MSVYKLVVRVSYDGLTETVRKGFDSKPTKSQVETVVASAWKRFGGLSNVVRKKGK